MAFTQVVFIYESQFTCEIVGACEGGVQELISQRQVRRNHDSVNDGRKLLRLQAGWESRISFCTGNTTTSRHHKGKGFGNFH